MKRAKTAMIGLAGAVCFFVGTANLLMAAKPASPLSDLTQGGKRDTEHDWTLGPTGLRGWIYGRDGQTSYARQILVTKVDKGSPADGIFAEGDVILGLAGKPFAGDARIQFAKAITAAEQENAGGRFPLIRWRAGKTETVELKLGVMGAYNDDDPFNCPKSKKIFEQGCQAIAKKGLGKVSIPNNLNALALLASGKEEYRPMLAAYAKTVAAYQTGVMATWHYGYANMFLSEYCMATGDKSVLPGIKRIALESARGQSGVGTWGHKFARPDGNLGGYGAMNQPALSLMISMVLARQAGVKEPDLDRAIAKGAGFLRWFVNKGSVPYGDHLPYIDHEDNGKCSSATVLFDLLGDREAAAFFSRMAMAAYDERERGHTGNFFNILWALPGVSRCGSLATGLYMKEQSWYYDLARNWQGVFSYQGSPAGSEEHNRYTNWDCTGAYLLTYALPMKSLYLTGKQPSSVPQLNRQQAEEVIAAGRDFFPVNGKNGYDERKTETLIAGLTSWSPILRKRSAQALGKRKAKIVPELLKMLNSTDLNTRYGAIEALGCLGSLADSTEPQLRALLKESDPWLQSLACYALKTISKEVRKNSINDVLAMIARPNPSDPRKMAQRAASSFLFARVGKRGEALNLDESLKGVDRSLLYPAVQSLLKNEESIARNSFGYLYRKLNDRDLAVLLPDIVQAIEKLAPSNEMFADSIRLYGLDLLSHKHIREGMPLCISVMDPGRWGGKNRVPQCLEYITRYGTHAKEVLPQLQEMRKTAGSMAEEFDTAIAAIKNATNTPTLVDIKHYVDRPAAVQK